MLMFQGEDCAAEMVEEGDNGFDESESEEVVPFATGAMEPETGPPVFLLYRLFSPTRLSFDLWFMLFETSTPAAGTQSFPLGHQASALSFVDSSDS